MPVSIPRLRTWFAVLAIAMVMVVAGFYFYARYRVRSAVREIPKKLGVEIQQSTDSFSLSKSEGGRTLFTIKASKAVQYKQGGRATLKDVNIVVYGRKSNRFDQIYGSDFEYDPQTGEVRANGDVHIDLEANAEGPGAKDQATPQEMKNPIHLKTSGLVFNQKTGLAHTDQAIEFRVPQASGSAMGASYDSKQNLLTLTSNVQIVTTGPTPTTINAAHGEITNQPRQVTMEEVKLQQETRDIEASKLAMLLSQNNQFEKVIATGDVRLRDTGANGMTVRAPRADVNMGDKNAVRSATFSGGVQMEATGDRAMKGNAGKVSLEFGAENRLSRVVASEGVHIVQQPDPHLGARNGGSKAGRSQREQSQAVDIEAPMLTLRMKDGKRFDTAETQGPSKITLVSQEAQHAGERTVVSADKFVADFDKGNRLSEIHGEPNAKVVASAPNEADKTTTSKSLTVQLAAAGGIAGIVQQGNFEYREPQSAGAKGTGGRLATADSARYIPADESFVLTGSPRVRDGGMMLSANSMKINRRTGDASAEGDVKTTYNEIKQEPNGAMLATADPVHVTSRSVTVNRKTGVARYTGGARLWQGPNIVEAATIEFDREKRGIVALGNGSPVSSVFVQADSSGKTTPLTVTAGKLTYVDAQRRARYSDGVTVKGADMTMTADHLDVLLHAGSTGGKSPTAPSQLEQIVAEGKVVVRQLDRRATGEKLVYTAADGHFVLTGGPPSISDAEHGVIRGDSLTFYSHDDRVLVESRDSSRTVTRTRVSR
jgi:lipopolysaccharide export system protein LptA